MKNQRSTRWTYAPASVCAPALAVLLVWGCAADPGARAATGESDADGGADEVVAQWEGRVVTRTEIDSRISGELARLRQEEYDLRRGAIDELVSEELLQHEAAKRGVSRDELLELEVEQKTPAPSRVAIELFYEQNKARVRGQSKESVLPQIEQMLTREAQAERSRAFYEELGAEAGLRVSLEAPRVEVPVPRSAPAMGPKDAPVTIVEFTDYQCPFCVRAQGTIDELMKRYAGKVRLVYRDLPLDMHSRAFEASKAARCAGEQDQFWGFHRSMLISPGDFSDEDFMERARELELDTELFTACLASPRHDPAINESLADADKLGVRATPTFFINGRMLSGAQPLGDFEKVIDEELERASS